MRFRNLLAGATAAALMVGRAEAASPSQPSYVVRLPPAGSYGSNDNVTAFLGMWFDPACNTLGTGAGCPRPASTDFPFPVTSTPAPNSPGSSAGTPSYTQDGTDPSAPIVANPGTGARGWLAGILGAMLPPSQTAATDTNRLAIANPDVLSVAGSVTSAAVIAMTDTTSDSSVASQITSVGTGNTVVYETSNDNATWVPAYGAISSSALATPASSDTTAAFRVFPVTGKYFRIRVSVYGSGTVTVAAFARQEPIAQLDPQAVARSVALAASTASIGYLAPPIAAGVIPTLSRVTSAATTNATLALTGSRSLLGYRLANTSASWVFFKVSNLATAPVPGTTAPVLVIAIPPNSSVEGSSPFGIINASLGLGYWITGAYGDTDTTAVAAGQVVGFITYR